MNRRNLIGLGLLVLFALTQGARDVYLSSAFASLGFFDIVFIAFTSATLFFSGLLAVLAPADFRRLKKEWRGVVAVNLTTALAWLCYFGALNMIEPTVANTIFAGVAPTAVAVLSLFGLRSADRARASAAERALHAGIVGALMVLAWIVLSGRSGLHGSTVLTGMRGLLLAAASGFIITAETVFAKRMNEAGISAIGVLSFRFVLISAIGAFAVFALGETEIRKMPFGELTVAALKIFFLIAAPLFLVGKGLAMTSPMTTGVAAAFGPAAVFFLQTAEGRIPTSSWVLSVTLAYALLAAFSVLARARFQKIRERL